MPDNNPENTTIYGSRLGHNTCPLFDNFIKRFHTNRLCPCTEWLLATIKHVLVPMFVFWATWAKCIWSRDVSSHELKTKTWKPMSSSLYINLFTLVFRNRLQTKSSSENRASLLESRDTVRIVCYLFSLNTCTLVYATPCFAGHLLSPIWSHFSWSWDNVVS